MSGGADSLALALLLKENGLDIVTATVNHNLRPESQAEAEAVGKIMAGRGIPHVILTWDFDKKPTTRIQELARQARFDLFTKYAAANDIKFLCLGHNQDDQAETFIFRLCKSSGLDGLTAIKPVTQYTPPKLNCGFVSADVGIPHVHFGTLTDPSITTSCPHFNFEGVDNALTVVRPLLPFSRQQIETYLQAKNQSWIEDPSNQNPQYTRVRIRHIIKSLSGEGLTTETIANTIKKLELARDYLNSAAVSFINEHCTVNAMGFISVPAQQLINLHPELKLRVVTKLLQAVGGKHYPPRTQKLLGLITNLNSVKFSKAFTFYGCYICLRGEDLFFLKETNGRNMGWDQLIKFRSAKYNDKLMIKPLGYKGYCTVPSEVRQKDVPYQAHYGLLAIWQDNTLVAVPYLQYFPREDLIRAEDVLIIKFNPTF